MLTFITVVIFLTLRIGHCDEPVPRPEQFSYHIVQRYPHDPKAFTQGLAWDQGIVYEGTGLYGRSSLRRVDLRSGEVELKRDYERRFFAEGVTVFRNKIYQLTWKSKRVFQYEKEDLSFVRSWPFPRQGWGVTHDGDHLIVSDGTANLYFLDPESLVEKRRITVRDDQGEISRLNELEYIQGTVYANVWRTDRIAIIQPENGVVVGWLDLAGLSDRMRNKGKEDVLNGIMYDPVKDRLFVTGKLWSALFEIKKVLIQE